MRWQFIPTNCNEEQVPHRYSFLLLWKIFCFRTLYRLCIFAQPLFIRPPLRTRYLLDIVLLLLCTKCAKITEKCAEIKKNLFMRQKETVRLHHRRQIGPTARPTDIRCVSSKCSGGASAIDRGLY